MKKLVLAGLGLAVIVLIALGGVFVFEVLFRVVGPKPSAAARIDTIYFDHREYVVSTHPPNLVQTIRDKGLLWQSDEAYPECIGDGGVRVRFDSHGFRSPQVEPPPARDGNEFRVVIVGGSASIGWGVAEKCTLSEQLRVALQKQMPERHVTVFNIGSGAWKSFQELISIQRYGLALQPDIFVAFDFFNDIQQGYDLPIYRSYFTGVVDLAYAQYRARQSYGVADFASNFASIRWLQSEWNLQRTPVGLGSGATAAIAELPAVAEAPQPGKMRTRLAGLPVDLELAAKRMDFDPLNRQIVDTYLRNMRLMAKSASTIGAGLYAVLQPTLYLKDPLAVTESDILWQHYAHTVNFVAQGYARAIEGLSHLSKTEENLKFVDFSRAFSGEQAEIFADYVHLRPAGYARLADRLAERIASDGLR